MPEPLSGYEIMSTTFIGGRQHGKRKILEDMIALNEKIKAQKKAEELEMIRLYEINKEIFNEFEFMFETKDELSNWEFSFDGSSGILTASENTNGVTVNRELITKKFRLVEVKG